MARFEFIQELLSHSADGGYVIDQEQRIAAWNKAAEEILGFRAQDVVGMPCHQILGGHSDGGCVVCRRGCFPFTAASRGELVPCFDAQVRTATGYPRWVSISVVAIQIPADDARESARESTVIVHLFRDVEAKKRAETFAKDVAGWVRQLKLQESGLVAGSHDEEPTGHLTPREIQVLRLLARGADTDAIANQLVIDKSTTRNHIQRILHKLGVHSRLEAVTYARDHDLLD
jgi:DNA-binding CsgD family transcriptional regulator